MVPKTPVNIHYQNKYIDLLVILVPDNIVVENTARTSTPKKPPSNAFPKTSLQIGAQNTFEKTQSKYDGVGKLVNKKFNNGSQKTVKEPYSKKTVP